MAKAVFFCHYAGGPFFNMAFDEWLLGQALSEPAFVSLRLYTWQPGAITFGFNQKKELALDFSRVSDTPVIRRITGGRAIYHDPEEITYSIAVNTSNLDNAKLNGSLSGTSSAIAEALTLFLASLGIRSHYLRRSSSKDSKPIFSHTSPCFDSAARYEIVAKSRKIVASAQRRVGKAFLQHGSIKVNGIAAHPALSLKSILSLSPSSGPTIGKEEFDAMAAQFVKVMGKSLGLVFDRGCSDFSALEQIEKLTIYVEKNSLERRDNFKRLTGENSLYDRR
jgi:lipoate-protein ligase A